MAVEPTIARVEQAMKIGICSYRGYLGDAG